jgi:hypothetical protein
MRQTDGHFGFSGGFLAAHCVEAFRIAATCNVSLLLALSRTGSVASQKFFGRNAFGIAGRRIAPKNTLALGLNMRLLQVVFLRKLRQQSMGKDPGRAIIPIFGITHIGLDIISKNFSSLRQKIQRYKKVVSQDECSALKTSNTNEVPSAKVQPNTTVSPCGTVQCSAATPTTNPLHSQSHSCQWTYQQRYSLMIYTVRLEPN